MMTTDHAILMDELAARHDALLPLLRGGPLHYLDLPFHDNVGDLLIMLGTMRFLQKHALPVKRMAMYFNYSPRWAAPGDIIALHGGGNFGDIYGPFQAFRERVVRELPNNRIILLPQSIHFAEMRNFERCAQDFRKHRDLHICVRDRESEKLARELTPNVYLMPDMAHQLWPMARTGSATRPVLHLRRRDSEAPPDAHVTEGSFDWDDLVGKNWRFFLAEVAERTIHHAHRFGLNKPFANLEARLWIAQAERFCAKAATLFAQFERIESNRLHAHILSCLLSIPNRIADNSYGKNSRYISTWTAQSPLVTLDLPARDMQELVA